MLFLALQLFDEVNALLLGIEFGVSHDFIAVLDNAPLILVDLLHRLLIPGDHVGAVLVKVVLKFLELPQISESLGVLGVVEYFLEHVVSAVNLRVDEVLVNHFVAVLCFLGILLILDFIESLSVLGGSRQPHVLVDKLIVQVFEILEDLNGVEFIILVVLPRELERIVGHLEDLQLVLETLQILNCLVQVPYVILANAEDVQLGEGLEAFQFGNPV